MTSILVIDDDLDIRINIVEALSLQDFTYFEASNGLIGLEYAKKHLPDLVICDINMPEMDGYQVLSELRKDSLTANIPFVFLTSQTDKMFVRQGMNLGADDYLTKPFTWEELLTAVTTRLGKHALFVQENEHKLGELRENILYALPHELRTPLAGIIGSAELIVDYGENLDRQKIINMAANILESGQRLHSLLENYLLYVQLEIIHSDPERIKKIQSSRVEDPQVIIHEIAKRQAALVQREHDLSIHVNDMPPLQISIENLGKIVIELVDNALKFSPVASLIEIKTWINDSFYLQVGNHGRGMTAEHIKNIAPYIQFERKIYEQQGSGMGLVIVRRLAQLHGGDLFIKSTPGEMTQVTITLPLLKDDY